MNQKAELARIQQQAAEWLISAAAGRNRDDVITVQARVLPGPMEIGSQQLTAEDIAKKPQANGNVTELLRTNPNVQFAEASRSSASPGGDCS